ncbi:molybdenum cofactor guanylyltransferase [Paenibacillus hexagrammi]|uniref:Molybdenum cofactor guanylyltransferase n=1 Tax=Paenibacillus hexagrammi TaxID=2908839 RepID=A0ABY3SEV2_9BACL|nr:molybdenum cofactor guanylyltransferase [Paenibacillus sp. YPD9-1]UJF32426.1 molybdenum cofactor guanylyltransferase [Paenibacillus sp. YPD9-1]
MKHADRCHPSRWEEPQDGGRLKALLPYKGSTILHIQLAEMRKICGTVFIVTNNRDMIEPEISSFQGLDIRIISDVYLQAGPLAGIHAACKAASGEQLWVVGCDMPHLSADAAIAMKSRLASADFEAVIPVIGGRIHPLHGIYSRKVGDTAEQLLIQEQYRVMELLQRCRWLAADDAFFAEHGIALQFASNLNTPEEYHASMMRNET